MKKISTAFVVAALAAAPVFAAPIGVNGVIGTEWDGVTRTHVTHSPLAPTSNFQTPTNLNAGAGYDVMVRSDADFYYVGVEITDNASASPDDFANIYLDLNPANNDGSEIGFEVGQNGVQGFIAGGPQFDATGFTFSGVSNGVVELAIANSNLLAATNSVPNPNDFVRVNLSQSFGYSVAGGLLYGENRLGIAAVPEPAALGVIGVAAAGLLMRRRRAR